MNRKIITLTICIGLIAITAPTSMGLKTKSRTIGTNQLIKRMILGSSQTDTEISTGGILYEDFYEIEILDGNYRQVKKLQRALRDNFGIFLFIHLQDVDIKITYKKPIEDPENSTEFYVTYLFDNSTYQIINGSEIMDKPHTVIIKGFNGWFMRLNAELIDTSDQQLNCFLFGGNYESMEILET